MNLKAVLEGLLFVQGEEGLSSDEMLDLLGVDKKRLHDIIDELANEYLSEDRGLKLEYFGGKLKIVTKKEHAKYYEKLFNHESSTTLGQSSLEVLAIVAYNEPVTRIMVDEIRGVSSAHIIRKLVFKNFIKEVGRSDLPGKPILYGVTDQFLDHFGLSSTKELPAVDMKFSDEKTDLFASKCQEND